MNASVLLIDDDRELCALLGDFLQLEGFTTTAIHDGAEAIDHLQCNSYDAVVLDIMLPGIQGLDILRAVRKFSSIPVLMLTARGDDTDRILGLELGADDYLPKPCNPRELAARIRAILRRAQPDEASRSDTRLEVAGARLDSANRSAFYQDKELQLTSAEFNVLRLLLASAGAVVDKETLCLEALGRQLTPYDRSVDVHISKIRKKLAAAGGDNLIVSVRGSGYQFTINALDT